MKKSFKVTIDKERHLRYGFVALSMIEDELDKPISKIDFENVRIKEIAALAWAGLYHEDNTLTPQSVLELIDESDTDYTKLMTTIGEAISGAFEAEKK